MAMERVMRGADASLVVMHILTSKKMPKRVYIDDVIDRVALFLRFQLANTIYPSYDPIYKEISKSKTGYIGSMKKKRTYASGPRDRNILALYNKTHELASLLADLVRMQGRQRDSGRGQCWAFISLYGGPPLLKVEVYLVLRSS